MALSRRDFHEVSEFLRVLTKTKDRTTRYALLTSAIIAYARPFSGNERDPRAMAEKSLHIKPAAILSVEQVALHTEVLRIRNKLVAHAEFALSPIEVPDSQDDGMTLRGPYVRADGRLYDLRDYLQRIDLAVFKRIAELYAVHCLNEMYKLLKGARTMPSSRTADPRHASCGAGAAPRVAAAHG